MSLLYVAVTLKDDPNLALVQTALRNAGFDQKQAVDGVLEGTIDDGQVSNLLTVPYVDGVRTLREVHQ